jgi:hypothetical protein
MNESTHSACGAARDPARYVGLIERHLVDGDRVVIALGCRQDVQSSRSALPSVTGAAHARFRHT